MNSTSSTIDGSSSSQPWTHCVVRVIAGHRTRPVATAAESCDEIGAKPGTLERQAVRRDDGGPPRGSRYLYGRSSRSASRCASFIACSGRLGAGERRLQAVVQRLGHALVVVRRQLGLGERKLVARHRGRREAGDVLLHHRRVEGIRRAPRRSRCRCPTARRAAGVVTHLMNLNRRLALRRRATS